MFNIERKKGELTQTKKPNKVLDILNSKKQTYPNVVYLMNPHSRYKMQSRKISEKEIIKSIEEFDKHYVNDDRTIVEKQIGNHVIRTVYSYNMYTNEISIISTMHINKRKFFTPKIDIF
jgi:polysaccharide deacetylase 2 family uncharacterized protein YibQ